MAFKTWTNPAMSAETTWTEGWRCADIGAGNGHGNARSLVRLQSAVACGGEVDGVRLLSPKTIDRIFEVQFNGIDLVIGIPIKWGVGYGLAPEGRVCSWGGAGGSLVIIDVDRRMTFAYVMNKMAPGGGTIACGAGRAGERHRESLSHVLDRISVIQPPTRVASQPRTPAIKSSHCVLSPRLFHNLKSLRWLRKRLATGFELSRGGPAKEIKPSGRLRKVVVAASIRPELSRFGPTTPKSIAPISLRSMRPDAAQRIPGISGAKKGRDLAPPRPSAVGTLKTARLLLIVLLPLPLDIQFLLLAPEFRRAFPLELVPVNRQLVLDGDLVIHVNFRTAEKVSVPSFSFTSLSSRPFWSGQLIVPARLSPSFLIVKVDVRFCPPISYSHFHVPTGLYLVVRRARQAADPEYQRH